MVGRKRGRETELSEEEQRLYAEADEAAAEAQRVADDDSGEALWALFLDCARRNEVPELCMVGGRYAIRG